MDFGKILEQWEAEQKRNKSAKKREEIDRAHRELSAWLEAHPEIPSKEAGVAEERKQDKADTKIHPRQLPVEAELDLHGMNKEEASKALKAFLAESRSRGFKKVLIIHGKGAHSKREPVLKKLVREILEKSTITGTFEKADRGYGGSGAVWVILREKKR